MDGTEWRIDGTIPGERVRVATTGRSRGAAVGWARLEAVLAPAPEGPGRRAAPCPHHDACGACGLQHASDAGRFEALVRSAAPRLPRPLVEVLASTSEWLCAPEPMGYRHKAILLPAQASNGVVLGGFARGTHDVVDLPECTVVTPSIRTAAAALREALEPALTRGALAPRPPGSPTHGPPGVRAVILRATRSEGLLATFVVTDRRAVKVLRPIAARLVKAGALSGAWLQEHDGQGDSVVGRRRPRLLAGARAVHEDVAGMSFPLGPLSFFQVNPTMLEAMLPEIRRALVDCRSVVDAYCGVGVLGLTCAPPGAELLGIEVNEEAVEIARRVARTAGREAKFSAGAPGTRNDLPESCDGLIVDPPRSGCRPNDLDALLRLEPRTVVHVACSTDALARDARQLFERGFRAERLLPAEMLPQTPHLEWVASFRRR